MTVLFGFLNPLQLSRKPRVASVKQEAQCINLVRFETFVGEGFLNREHVESKFFNLEKSYDTTWKYRIMKDLYNKHLKGRLPLFI